jgi:hypothetical protein
MKLTSFALAVLALTAAQANAQVVVGTNLQFNWTPHAGNLNRYHAVAFWTPDPHADASWHAGFEYDGRALTLRGDIEPSINGNGNFYVMQPGDVLSHATANQLMVIRQTPITVPPGDRYLGARIIGGLGTSFGWLHLRPGQDKVLRVVSNALAFGTNGIIVGTTQVVPEPAAWIMVAAGAIVVFWRGIVVSAVRLPPPTFRASR